MAKDIRLSFEMNDPKTIKKEYTLDERTELIDDMISEHFILIATYADSIGVSLSYTGSIRNNTNPEREITIGVSK